MKVLLQELLANKKRLALSIAILLILLVITFHSLPHKSKKGNAEITVATATVKEKDVLVQTQAVGNVQASSTVSIRSRVDGPILSVGFNQGDDVKAGQVLFLIDPKPYQVSLEQAQANLARDTATLNNAKLTYNRNAALVNKGYIAKQDFDQIKANVATAEATVKADTAAVESAKLQLDYCTIRSPIDGRTGSLLVNIGNLIKASDVSALVTINQVSPIYVTFSVPEQQLPSIQAELAKGPIPVTATIKNTHDTIQGNLTFIDNTVDTTTGMVQLKASFANQDRKLWPGEFVSLSLPVSQINHAMVVPTRAVQAGMQGDFVFVINKDHVVETRNIKTGPSIGEQTVIKSGLKPSEVVVTEGQMRLTDGVTVKINNSFNVVS
jgi:multidrug efflux system membrane fusion protein